MKLIAIFAILSSILHVSIVEAGKDPSLSTNDENLDNQETPEAPADTQEHLNFNVTTNEMLSESGFLPLIISIKHTLTVAYILNVSYKDRPAFVPGEIYLFACPFRGEKPKRIEPLTENWFLAMLTYTIGENSDPEGSTHHKLEKKHIEDAENLAKCKEPIKPFYIEVYSGYIDQRTHKVGAIGFEVFVGEEYQNLNKNKDQATYKYFVESYLGTVMGKGFKWFTVILVQFDLYALDVKNVFYKMNEYLPELPNPDPNPEAFKNYQLGHNSLFEKVPIESLYSIENQTKIFSKIFPDEKERSRYFDNIDKHLIPVHLAPLDVYNVPYMKETAMTFANLAPMWKVIRENAWKNFEHYLHLMAQVIREAAEEQDPSFALEIISGTYGVLELPAGTKIFLGFELPNRPETVSVPLAFYKIVALQLPVLHSILIVTVNNPYYKQTGEILCKQDQCEKYGWTAVQNQDYTKGRTFCCELNEKLVTLLRLKTEYFPEYKVLDLTDKKIFKHYFDEANTTVNLQQYIENHRKRVEEFFEEVKPELENAQRDTKDDSVIP